MDASSNASTRVTADMHADRAIPLLVDAEGGRLFSLALRFCGDRHEAEDLVQETFLQAFRKWDTFRGEADPATWLYTIAARGCQRMHRRRSGEPEHIASLNEALPARGPVPDLPQKDDDPLAAQLRREAREHVERAIADLPVDYRMPLVLKDIVGFSVEQVAQVTGVKAATIKTRLHRARLMIRETLSRHLPSRDAPPPAYDRQVCLDLLAAKQEALDRHAPFPMPPDFCDRCRAVFASMDLVADMCGQLGKGELPDAVRAELAQRLTQKL